MQNYNITRMAIAIIIILIVLSIVVLFAPILFLPRVKNLTSLEKFNGYGRPIGHLYTSKYTPRAPYTATNHNYGWMCMGGNCEFRTEGLLSYDDCKKACVVEKASWIPPWREITI